MSEKWVPDTVMTLFGRAAVERVAAYPPDNHPTRSPIRRDLTAVEVVTARGSRWYGVGRAFIDSHLKMRVAGFNPKFEEMASWPDAE